MPARKDVWKFTSSITKFINRQWSKLKSSSDDSLKSSGILDQLLQEEYASLIQEINTFDAEKPCFLCFKNDRFSVQSSRDLTKILKKHSEEVLKHFITEHDPHVKSCARNGSDLVNYVTKVVVSRSKCNRELCNHSGKTPAREVPTKKCNQTVCDCKRPSSKPPQKNPPINPNKPQKAVSTETAPPKPIETQTSEIPLPKIEQLDTEAQTDPWEHDLNCSCGCCPKTHQVNEMNVATEEQTLRDTSTSHAVLTDTKSVQPIDQQAENIEIQTSSDKVCLPGIFQSLLKANVMITTCLNKCPNKADCGCDVYGNAENACVQTQKSTEQDEIDVKPIEQSLSLHGTEQPSITIQEDKTKRDFYAATKTPYEYEYEITPTSKVKKEKKKSTGCFGSKKKKNKGCSEDCQGINSKPRAMQTEKVKTVDKNEEVHLHTEKRTNQTSTGSEAAIQVTNLTSTEDFHARKEDERKRPHKTVLCDKCGRPKKSCDNGCRNTIIIPQISKSGQAMLSHETESLRKLIKMQNEDTNRQFDSIMARLSHQSSEITRLNDVYRNLVRQGFESSHQSAVISNRKKESESSRYQCGCSLKFDQQRSCGCKYSNECRISTSRIMMDNKPPKKFGPPNTAVAINVCNLPTSQIGEPLEEKQRKELLNHSKRSTINQRGPFRDNDPRARGDSGQFQISSLSTIYKHEDQYNQRDSVEKRTVNYVDVAPTYRNCTEPPSTKLGSGSKVQVWLKKSSITVKHTNDHNIEGEKNRPVTQMLILCQNAAKKVVTGAWKYVRRT